MYATLVFSISRMFFSSFKALYVQTECALDIRFDDIFSRIKACLCDDRISSIRFVVMFTNLWDNITLEMPGKVQTLDFIAMILSDILQIYGSPLTKKEKVNS